MNLLNDHEIAIYLLKDNIIAGNVTIDAGKSYDDYIKLARFIDGSEPIKSKEDVEEIFGIFLRGRINGWIKGILVDRVI